MLKTNEFWRMTVDFHKLNQVVTLIAAAVPNVVPLLEQINTSPGTGNIAVDLVFFLHSCPGGPPEAVCF